MGVRNRNGRTVSMLWRVTAILTVATWTALASAGCSNLRTVNIGSVPEGATIYLNGEKKGVTPSTISIPFSGDPRQRAIVQIVKEGYRPMFQSWTVQEVPTSNQKEFTLEVD